VKKIVLDRCHHRNCLIGCHASASEVITRNPWDYRFGPLHEVAARTPLATRKKHIALVGPVCRLCDLEPHLLSPEYVLMNGGPKAAGVRFSHPQLADWSNRFVAAEIGIADMFIRELPTMTAMKRLGSKRAILEHLATGVFTTNERRSGKSNSTMIAVHLTMQASERIINGDLVLAQFDIPPKKPYYLCAKCPVDHSTTHGPGCAIKR